MKGLPRKRAWDRQVRVKPHVVMRKWGGPGELRSIAKLERELMFGRQEMSRELNQTFSTVRRGRT